MQLPRMRTVVTLQNNTVLQNNCYDPYTFRFDLDPKISVAMKNLEDLKVCIFTGAETTLLLHERANPGYKQGSTYVVCDESDWDKCRIPWNRAVMEQSIPRKCVISHANDEAGEHRFLLIENNFKYFFFDIIRFAACDKHKCDELKYDLPKEVRVFLEHQMTHILCTSELEVLKELFPLISNNFFSIK